MSEPAGPGLDAAALARAFPFHLCFDAGLRLCGWGRSIGKALPGLAAGRPLADLFTVRRPRLSARLDDWKAFGQDLCTLASVERPALKLRGSAEVLADGRLLLLVAPVVLNLSEVSALGLSLNDFARHDATGELLMIGRTLQMSVDDAERMARQAGARSAQIETMLQLSPGGVAYFDAQDTLKYLNRHMEDLLGAAPGELQGLDLDAFEARLTGTLIPAEQSLRPLLALRDAPADGMPASPVLTRQRPGYALLRLDLQASEDGGQVLFLRDVTREVEVDRMKTEFLSMAAHELRTPMVSILGFSELLLHRDFDERRRRDLLGTIHRQTGLLVKMVSELLDLARIESRQGRDFVRRVQPLQPLLRRTAEALLMQDDPRTVRLDLPGAEVSVDVDEDKLQLAVTNVLSNAFKYSRGRGEVRLDLSRRVRAGHAEVGIRVHDEGAGMDAEQVARIFDRFWRADTSGNVPGTGLGMSITKEVVELHGGRVEIDSRPGEGTTVTVWLPVAAQPPALSAADAPPCAAAPAASPTPPG